MSVRSESGVLAMSSVLRTKTYSLKDTFLMLVKCLVFTIAFLFLDIYVNNTAIEGYSDLTYLDYDSIYTDSDLDVSCTGYGDAPYRPFGCKSASIEIEGSASYYYAAFTFKSSSNYYYTLSGLSSNSGQKTDSSSVTLKYRPTFHIVVSNKVTSTQVCTSACTYVSGVSYDSSIRNVFYIIPLKDISSEVVLLVTGTSATQSNKVETWELKINFTRNFHINNFTVRGNSEAKAGYTNTSSLSLNIDVRGGLGTLTYAIVEYCVGTTSWYNGHWEFTSSGTTTKPTSLSMHYTSCKDGSEFKLFITESLSKTSIETTARIIYDSGKPTASISCSDALGSLNCNSTSHWASKSYVVTLTASDSKSGIDHYECSTTSGSGFTDCGTSSTFTYNETQNITRYYRVVDKAGNVSEECKALVKLDLVAPTISSSNIYDPSENALSGYTNEVTIGVSISATTTGPSGIGAYQIEYKPPNSTSFSTKYSDEDAPTSFTLNDIEGQHTLKFYVFSNAGKADVVTLIITYDKTAPTITGNLTVTGNAGAQSGYTNARKIKVTSLPTTSETTGITYYLASHSNQSGVAYVSNSVTPVEVGTEIELEDFNNYTHTIVYAITDAAGNTSRATTTIFYDKTKPVFNDDNIVINCPKCNKWITDKSTKVALEVKGATDDGGSGVAGYHYTYDKSTYKNDWDDYDGADGAKGQWSAERDNIVYFRAYDKAGNYSDIPTKTTRVMIDRSAPTGGSISCSPVCGEWTNKRVTVTLSGATDSISGISGYKYSYDNSTYYSPEVGNATQAKPYWTENRNTEVHFRAYDAAGHYIYLGSEKIMIDNTAPTLEISGSGATFKVSVNDALSGYKENYEKKYYISATPVDDEDLETIFAVGAKKLITDSTDLYRIMGSGKYYIYVDVYGIQDNAGNSIAFNDELDEDCSFTAIYIKHNVKRLEVDYDSSSSALDPVNELISGLSVGGEIKEVDKANGNLKKEVEGENYTNVLQIQNNQYFILTINEYDSESDYGSISVLEKWIEGIEFMRLFGGIIGLVKSNIRENVLLKIKDAYKYKFVTIIVVCNSPHVVDDEDIPASLVVNQGDELNNIGMSFESVNGEAVTVETLITLNGVRVKEVDTSKAGVYNVRQIATDSSGRQTRISREIIVQEVAKVQEVKELVQEVSAVPVEVVKTITQEPQVKVQEEVKVELQEVEMHLEKKTKVKGYKKKKEIKKVKKESFTFKLFSKYFFKIYDG